MLQKEVVDRMTAQPGHGGLRPAHRDAAGAISTSSDCSSFRRARSVRAPKVDSAVARLRPLRERAPRVDDFALFSRLVAAAFSQRRKTLRNARVGAVRCSDDRRAPASIRARAAKRCRSPTSCGSRTRPSSLRRRRLPFFDAVLGPDYNAAHRDHLHFDRGVLPRVSLSGAVCWRRHATSPTERPRWSDR